MSAVINITQKFGDGNTESTTIDLCDIIELHCVLPTGDEDEENIDDELSGIGQNRTMRVEFLLSNGERRDIDLATPTVFVIINEEGSIKKTTKLHEFEEMYIKTLAVGEAKSANKRILIN